MHLQLLPVDPGLGNDPESNSRFGYSLQNFVQLAQVLSHLTPPHRTPTPELLKLQVVDWSPLKLHDKNDEQQNRNTPANIANCSLN